MPTRYIHGRCDHDGEDDTVSNRDRQEISSCDPYWARANERQGERGDSFSIQLGLRFFALSLVVLITNFEIVLNT